MEGVKVELSKRKRICLFCEEELVPGSKCIKFMHTSRSICVLCFKESCVKVFGLDAFSTSFKSKIMAEVL